VKVAGEPTRNRPRLTALSEALLLRREDTAPGRRGARSRCARRIERCCL